MHNSVNNCLALISKWKVIIIFCCTTSEKESNTYFAVQAHEKLFQMCDELRQNWSAKFYYYQIVLGTVFCRKK